MLYCHRFFPSPIVIVDCKGKKKFPDENICECNGNDMQATASLPHLAVKFSSVESSPANCMKGGRSWGGEGDGSSG